MSSDNEPTWRTCRRAVWMLIQNSNNLADAQGLLNRQEDQDLHIASGKCFILLLTAIQTPEKSCLERALAECKWLESLCSPKTASGWLMAVRRKLFPSKAAGVDEYDRQITLADVTACMVGLTVVGHAHDASVTTAARSLYALRRAWKMYQQCYASVLNLYRDIYDLDPDRNVPQWPPVLKRRRSVTLAPALNIGTRMLRSATTSFETLRQNSVSDSDAMPDDVVRLMTAVSVGYGAFNLMVSLLPPTVVSVIGMLGFRGHRQIGLDALAFATNGPDVHAPLAWAILSWYRMMGNTDFMFDGPQSRESESHVIESERLVRNPPEEFQNSTSLQYFVGRLNYLKGDLEESIRAYEFGSTIVEYCFVNMKAMYSHELGFMYAIGLDWTVACRKFASLAGDNEWMKPYHYFMATVCAGAAGDAATGELMWQRVDETASKSRWRGAERDMVGSLVVDRKRAVARALRRTTAAGDGQRFCRLVVFEVLYVKYGAARWPEKTLRVVLADCREAENDDDTTRYTKRILAIVCRRALGLVDDYCGYFAEVVEHMERDGRRDHLYAYGLYELAAEQISRVQVRAVDLLPSTSDEDSCIIDIAYADESKKTIQKLNDLRGPYHFQYFYEMRCASLQAYVQRTMNVR